MVDLFSRRKGQMVDMVAATNGEKTTTIKYWTLGTKGPKLDDTSARPFGSLAWPSSFLSRTVPHGPPLLSFACATASKHLHLTSMSLQYLPLACNLLVACLLVVQVPDPDARRAGFAQRLSHRYAGHRRA